MSLKSNDKIISECIKGFAHPVGSLGISRLTDKFDNGGQWEIIFGNVNN